MLKRNTKQEHHCKIHVSKEVLNRKTSVIIEDIEDDIDK